MIHPLSLSFVTIVTLLRTFLVVCFACCQKCPCPNLCGGSYNTVSKLSGGAFALQTIYISKLSIAKSSNPEPIETLISYVLQLHQQPLLAQDKRVLSYFEQIINGLVYELYLPQDLHIAECSIAAHLPTLAPIDSLESLRSLFEQLSQPDRPLKRNLMQGAADEWRLRSRLQQLQKLIF